ncbi:hypothetical protein HMPREF9171_1650 [Streptococcus agalactiae ATCC 13813]|nr:hypothetical protein HMPREF9171_1650 [Streptococcus agalactiae ATCC 13813]KLL26970.1 hypothetical protein WA00_08955 [Streptococcus agalactiae]KLL93435.1 hypothetical protein VZ99_07775 [Streptococcus agalactiae]SUN11234.1 Uncharacterised protein [Streptococcus agalactiae]SUN21551.1 Uncharacterised protein [Streptococcus agalactiae]
MTTNKDNDTSERSGCHRKRTAGERPMSDITNHTHGGSNFRGSYMKQEILEYHIQRSLLEILFHKNLLTQVEYINIKTKLDRKYKNFN